MTRQITLAAIACSAPTLRPVRRPRQSPFRTRRWQIWRQTYLAELPAQSRGAWVLDRDTEAAKAKLAMVQDLTLGGIQLQSRHHFDSGTLLRVELWDHKAGLPSTLLVRVLSLSALASGEWLHHCTFATEHPAVAS